MKNFILILFIIIFSGACSGIKKTTTAPEIPKEPEQVIITIEDTAKIDELKRELKTVRDSLSFYRDSISYENYINSRRIEKIKYYITICDKKSTNKKYFFGWIKRTMSE